LTYVKLLGAYCILFGKFVYTVCDLLSMFYLCNWLVNVIPSNECGAFVGPKMPKENKKSSVNRFQVSYMIHTQFVCIRMM